MIDNSWYLDLMNVVFSKIKARVTADIGKKYKDLNITMDGKVKDKVKLPTIYIQFVQMKEIGQSLEGDMISAVELMVQTNICVSQDQGFKTKFEVQKSLVNAMKSLMFNTTMNPQDFDNGEILTSVMRFDRIFGNGDEI